MVDKASLSIMSNKIDSQTIPKHQLMMKRTTAITIFIKPIYTQNMKEINTIVFSNHLFDTLEH